MTITADKATTETASIALYWPAFSEALDSLEVLSVETKAGDDLAPPFATADVLVVVEGDLDADSRTLTDSQREHELNEVGYALASTWHKPVHANDPWWAEVRPTS